MSTANRLEKDVVVLVPGFMGFRQIGEFSYFSPEIVDILKDRLGEHGVQASVRAALTVPAGRLQDRVQFLGAYLDDLRAQGAEHFYLVGHSTGGVDAQLFATRAPFWGGTWPEKVKRAQEHTKAVVTISAPHYGTALLESAAILFLAHPTRAPQGWLPLALALLKLPRLLARDLGIFRAALNWQALQVPDLLAFLGSVARHHELFDELTPSNMAAIRGLVQPLSDIQLTCFASGVQVVETGTDPSDPFFARLNELTGALSTPPLPEVLAGLERLRSASSQQWIENTLKRRFPLEVGTNDGVVNIARQLLPHAKFGGIVHGDHCDVIGDFDREEETTQRRLSTGLFHSGAGFGFAQLSDLYRSVADSFGPFTVARELPRTALAPAA
jgi:pimeloyl-ACP methyl ester carboxylesterase